PADRTVPPGPSVSCTPPSAGFGATSVSRGTTQRERFCRDGSVAAVACGCRRRCAGQETVHASTIGLSLPAELSHRPAAEPRDDPFADAWSVDSKPIIQSMGAMSGPRTEVYANQCLIGCNRAVLIRRPCLLRRWGGERRGACMIVLHGGRARTS